MPATYEWNVTFEHQLPSNVVMRLAYVGSKAKASTGAANLLVSTASGGKFATNTFSTVQGNITDINAIYHSLQTSVEKRMSHGFTVLANYTYSKSLDDLPFGEGVTGFDTGYAALPLSDPNRHRFDYGPSGFDHTHVFSGSYVWQTPDFKTAGSFVRHVFGDYELSGIISASSGRPITVLQGTELSGTGIGNDRGTQIAGSNPYSSNSCTGVTAKCVSWLNPAAFLTTATLTAGCPGPTCLLPTFGNIGKNTFRLPGASHWDVQISKYISLTERWKLQLRAEYFNILNHPNFAPESTSGGTVNSTDQISAFDKLNGNSAFGTFRAGQAGDPRIAQFALKVIF